MKAGQGTPEMKEINIWDGIHIYNNRLPRWHNSKESTCQCSRPREAGLIPRLGRFPGVGHGNPLHRREWQLIPVFWPGECHGQRSLAGYSPWGRKESDTTNTFISLFHFRRWGDKLSESSEELLQTGWEWEDQQIRDFGEGLHAVKHTSLWKVAVSYQTQVSQ